jgi:hypothetical protein
MSRASASSDQPSRVRWSRQAIQRKHALIGLVEQALEQAAIAAAIYHQRERVEAPEVESAYVYLRRVGIEHRPWWQTAQAKMTAGAALIALADEVIWPVFEPVSAVFARVCFCALWLVALTTLFWGWWELKQW